jgi:hypothetical protein
MLRSSLTDSFGNRGGFMEKEIKDTILAALDQYEGDDFYRAKMAFTGLTYNQMQEPHGQSGQTRKQILDGYARHKNKVDIARNYVKGL